MHHFEVIRDLLFSQTTESNMSLTACVSPENHTGLKKKDCVLIKPDLSVLGHRLHLTIGEL